jgi:uncharacterized protein YndB with AHSA1/START domain
MDITHPDETRVCIRRRFAASPERLWRAFTVPADMAAWMWGGHAANCVAESDLRVGGRYSVYTDSKATADGWPSDRIGRLGIYVEIIPERRLVYTLHWDAPVGYNQRNDVVSDEVFLVSFFDHGVETVVAIEHIGIPSGSGANTEHGKGLADELENLARLAEG